MKIRQETADKPKKLSMIPSLVNADVATAISKLPLLDAVVVDVLTRS